MVSRFSQLVKHVEQLNPQLAADLVREYDVVSGRRAFGLNFERHAPETVELPGRPIRVSDKVRFMPERGATTSVVDERIWRVNRIDRTGARPVAQLVLHVPEDVDDVVELETTERDVDDLVVIAEFRDPIYPGMVSTGKVERGGDKPFHTVINAENFHALQTLLYTHEGKVDAIYIDPPYNTGARDWKYNNDYVDGEDIYRHSKWLAFMERRLKLAKRLLNPADSVLIVTIDEKEYLRLGLLLEQTFPEARIQMVSIAISPPGAKRDAAFRRSDEYAYFVSLGSAAPVALQLSPEWDGAKKTTTMTLRWVSLIRSGTGALRRDRPGMFYPIFLEAESGRFAGVGDAIPADSHRVAFEPPSGTIAVWPIREDGSEGRWQVGPDTARSLHDEGFLRVGKLSGGSASISYLKAGEQAKVRAGVFGEVTRSDRGHVHVEGAATSSSRVPTTQWSLASHSAADFGTRLLRNLLPERKFPFPKSLYAVEDTLRFYVADKPDAVILDFFAGSGTTAHAVMRLNRQDGGRRRSISVTNNEVGAEEQKNLRAEGLRPGDQKWEQLGICNYITKPRIEAAITGRTLSGAPVRGGYRFVDEFPMADGLEENVEFFTLTYETPRMVAHNRAFSAIAPLLWLRAGAEGGRIDAIVDEGFAVADVYGVLFDVDQSRPFIDRLKAQKNSRMAFIVTDDDRAFQLVCAGLPEYVEPVRLYESYLTNFTINVGGDR